MKTNVGEARRWARFAHHFLSIACVVLLLFFVNSTFGSPSHRHVAARDGRTHGLSRAHKAARAIAFVGGRRWSAADAPPLLVAAEVESRDDARPQNLAPSPGAWVVADAAGRRFPEANQTLRPTPPFEFPLHSPAP